MLNTLTSLALLAALALPCWGQNVVFVKKDSAPTCETGFADIGALGTANSASSGTSLVITTSATLEAGNAAFLLLGKDNACTVDGETSEFSGVVDSASNTWVKVAEFCQTAAGAANDGAAAALWMTKAANQLTSGGTITITLATATAKSAVAREFSMDSDCVLAVEDYDVLATDSSVDPQAMTFSGLPSQEYLFFRVLGRQLREDGLTATASFTKTAVAIADGGTGSTSITTQGEFRILAGTGATSDPSTSSDPVAANIFAAIKQVIP